MDLDVKAKAVVFGATFLIVSTTLDSDLPIILVILPVPPEVVNKYGIAKINLFQNLNFNVCLFFSFVQDFMFFETDNN